MLNKAIISLFLLFIVGSYCQPVSIQFFYQWPGYDYINYQVVRLSDGKILQNVTNINPDQYGIWGFLTTNDTSEILLFGTASNSIQVKSFWPSTDSFQQEFIASYPYSFTFALQPLLWNPHTLTTYVPGLFFNENERAVLSLLEFKLDTAQKTYPIELGISDTTTTRFNSDPVGAYDGSNYYYVYFSIDNIDGLAQYSFSQNTSKLVTFIEPVVPLKLHGIDQLYYFNGQLYYCKYVTLVGVTISTMSFDSGNVVVIYKDNNIATKGYQQNIQPFVFDPTTGTILILNTYNGNLYIDVFDILTKTVIKSSSLPNTIPYETVMIAPSVQSN
ncbi:hypothetical protein DFA_02069 [Cavenderia fasciculata]|uniref:Uncharacterized protein n=1 Tax=Cavenderia fasciculata TaxID=261658 RepID=F4PYL6_CACFS|nr:uncharacterized protein DFA_02069 [Cavenderia fasciculata]EGG19282.1 hypothetical protein DFA_02069 [Cavenderia fasciculata]|eukprot:XP_004357553.1 hypothetical protein DFA_02069 [Cavenderia fasciculata]